MPLEWLRLDRYFLVRLIEKGGMGEVYLAKDRNLDRYVAIKLIRTEVTSDTDPEAFDKAIRLFKDEAKAITMLEHPHILPLFDYGEKSFDGVRYTYMVMPYRREGSLANWLRRNRQSEPLSLPEVTHFLQQAVDALQYAHDHGIIHRDVKPSNFLIVGSRKFPDLPDLQLADFGVAQFTSAMPTPSSTIRGTPMYMAPEMWEGEAVPASDQYALAVMVYELLAGHPPFRGGNHHQLLYQHMYVQPQPVSKFNECVSMELDIVLMRALLKTPADRYDSIAKFGRAFEHAIVNGRNTHITLSISSAEARNGTLQVVALPSGRRVTVVVPRGAYDGQELRLEGLGERCKFDGPLGALIVTISITRPVVESASLTNTDVWDRTVPASSPYNDDDEGLHDPNQNRSKTPLLLLILSVILVIAIFAGLLAYSSSPKTSITFPQTVSNSTHQGITTPNANATAVSQANQTATANAISANGTATAQSTANAIAAGATATAISAQSTATAVSAQATATAIAIQATATAYANIMDQGTQAIRDPLQDNSQGHNWNITKLFGGGGCEFTKGAYLSYMPQQGPFSLCFAQATNFNNLTYQVKMKINLGTQGGIIFHADSTTGSFYYFHINNHNDTYGLDIYSGNVLSQTLSQGPVPSMLTGLGQTNLLGVVANGNKIDLYVNMQYVTSVNDSTYTSGQIGVVADAIDAATQVVFSDAQVNRLP